MKDKILINVMVTSLNECYDIYIPVNERIINILKELVKAVNDLSDQQYGIEYQNHILLNRFSGEQYTLDQIIIDTDIRNGTKLLLI